MTSKLAFGIVVCLSLTSQAATPVGSYFVTNLGDFAGGSNQSFANDINSMGQVVGRSSSADGERAYLWTPTAPNGTAGSLTDLGVLPRASISFASGINDRGQVVGDSSFSSGFDHAFLWSPITPNGTTGSMADLGVLPGWESASHANAINSLGQVVGTSDLGLFPAEVSRRAFLWTPNSPNGSVGSMINLGDLPGGLDFSLAPDINSFGQIAGSSGASSGGAYLWTPSTPNGTDGTMLNLGTLPGGGQSAAGALNSHGQVVGNTSVGTTLHSFLWSPDTPNGTTGTMTDLAPPAGSDALVAFDINARGQVVGVLNFLLPFRAFLWEPSTPNGNSGELIDLNSLMDPVSGAGWVLEFASAINDIGQIVGYGTFDADGPGGAAPVIRGFLLTPVPEPASAIQAAIAFTVIVTFFNRPIVPRATCSRRV
jgi:probable HAF family extracellular repeat protein